MLFIDKNSELSQSNHKLLSIITKLNNFSCRIIYESIAHLRHEQEKTNRKLVRKIKQQYHGNLIFKKYYSIIPYPNIVQLNCMSDVYAILRTPEPLCTVLGLNLHL